MKPGVQEYRILCYGDSNTYGYDPRDGSRYAADGRWPDVMAEALAAAGLATEAVSATPKTTAAANRKDLAAAEAAGVGDAVPEKTFRVLANGMNGRSIDLSSGERRDASGAAYSRFLERKLPADLLIIMLGSNNIPAGAEAGRITDGLERMCREFTDGMESGHGRTPKVLILAPPTFHDDSSFLWGDVPRYAAESRKLPALYAELAAKHGWDYLDVNAILTAGQWDGVHMTPENHRTLGRALAERVLAMAE